MLCTLYYCTTIIAEFANLEAALGYVACVDNPEWLVHDHGAVGGLWAIEYHVAF